MPHFPVLRLYQNIVFTTFNPPALVIFYPSKFANLHPSLSAPDIGHFPTLTFGHFSAPDVRKPFFINIILLSKSPLDPVRADFWGQVKPRSPTRPVLSPDTSFLFSHKAFSSCSQRNCNSSDLLTPFMNSFRG